MAVLTIRTVPDPILRQKTRRIRTIDASVKKLIHNMQETLHAEEGRAGLAAPQIGSLLRVTVISVPEEEEDIVLINPEIVKKKGERTVTEGCLSIPGYCAELTRAEQVTAKGLGPDGKEVRIKAEGLLAQALEHEIDHLDGVLYIDHLDDPAKLRPVTAEAEGEEAEDTLPDEEPVVME